MKKRTLLAGISLSLVASVAIAGTAAYLTDTDEAENTMVLGNVSIKQNEHQRVQNDDGTYATGTVDGRTSYLLEEFDQDKPILPIVGDPSESGNSPAYAGWDETTVRMSQINSYGGMQVFAGKNAQDKFVTVTNDGNSDAYVRTMVAVEVGSTGTNFVKTSSRAGSGTAPWIGNYVGIVDIDGTNYMLSEYIYRGASDVKRHENGVLPAGETTYPSLCQVYIKHNATNEDMVAIDGNGNGKLDVLVYSQAVQADGFDSAEKALDMAFGDITAENHPWA